MRLMLIGADCEENLGMCMIGAGAAARGHTTQVVAFDHVSRTDAIVRLVLERAPDCVGLAMQFQHRGLEFLSLATRLRAAGYAGHVTCGGQFPSMAWQHVLEGRFGIDSVVIHEGDCTIGELLDALQARRSLHQVPGLAVLRDGVAVRTANRPLLPELDELPVALRYRPHSRHFGVPFIPIWGSRGCWGSCTYCSISTCYRDARAHGGGRTLRFRSPRNLAREMALLWRQAGGQAIFCFHDETLLLPRPQDTLARLGELRRWLDQYGVGKAALVGKCRPESLTPELAVQLRELGVIRLYVGVENASQASSDHLNRRTTTHSLRNALDACLAGGIFPCYNLLLFEPEATLHDVEQNVAFMRQYANVPVNFCRAEPYHGTPLYSRIRAEGGLRGSFLGWDYRIKDDRTELLFRICSAVFRERNFDARGVTNRSMGLGYAARVLEFFHDRGDGASARILRKASELTRAMTLDKCDLLEQAIELARDADLSAHDRIERETALLGLKVAEGSRGWHDALDEILGEMDRFAASARAQRPARAPATRVRQAIQAVAVVGTLSAAAAACGGKTEVVTEQTSDAGDDAADEDAVGPYDALPYDSGTDLQTYDPLPEDAGTDLQTYDPLPEDAGTDDPGPYDALPYDSATDDPGPYDPLPYDSGTDEEPNVPDEVPPDAALDLGNLEDLGRGPPRTGLPAGVRANRVRVLERWRDTSPRRAMRSRDLPLYQPPVVALSATRKGERVCVSLTGGCEPVGTRWHADGQVIGDGLSVEWIPASDHDQLRVAVRTRGGVAIASLRLADVES